MSASILSLEPEHRTNRLGHHRGMKPGRSPGFCSILKRLAFSVVRRRNVLPSFKVAKQWPRSCPPASDEPFPASSPWLAKPRRNRGTVPYHSWPWWPYSLISLLRSEEHTS